MNHTTTNDLIMQYCIGHGKLAINDYRVKEFRVERTPYPRSKLTTAAGTSGQLRKQSNTLNDFKISKIMALQQSAAAAYEEPLATDKRRNSKMANAEWDLNVDGSIDPATVDRKQATIDQDDTGNPFKFKHLEDTHGRRPSPMLGAECSDDGIAEDVKKQAAAEAELEEENE